MDASWSNTSCSVDESILFPAKMFAFSEQAGYDSSMIEKLEALCMFNSLFYVDKWLKAFVGADASYNDLELWHDLNEYRKYDEKVANVAINALERHFWYLTEKCAVFSIFSHRLPDYFFAGSTPTASASVYRA